MKEIANHVAIVLTALFVPGGLLIALAIWVHRWNARHCNDIGGLAHAPRRLELKRISSKPIF
jgi:hypothetical protein